MSCFLHWNPSQLLHFCVRWVFVRRAEVQEMKENKGAFTKGLLGWSCDRSSPRTWSLRLFVIFYFYYKYCKNAVCWTDCGHWTLPDASAESTHSYWSQQGNILFGDSSQPHSAMWLRASGLTLTPCNMGLKITLVNNWFKEEWSCEAIGKTVLIDLLDAELPQTFNL